MSLSLPTEYQIGPVRVSPNVVLAPMEGVTDLSFRRLVRNIGDVGLTCTEFVPSAGLGHASGSRKGKANRYQRMCAFDRDERPVAIQIYGKDPAIMAEGAKKVADWGATIVDINMGCPSKKVCSNSGGSALMREPDLAIEIVSAVVAAVDVPVTVKMRSGFDAHHRNAPELAWRCQEAGAQAVAIHWRTREDKYSGQRQVDAIAGAKARLRIPVIANGDVVDVPSALRMFAETGCDGVMVGRGAIRNPWCIQQIAQAVRGEPPVQVGAAERKQAWLAYVEGIRTRFANDKGALGRFKGMAKYFLADLPGGAATRKAVLHSADIETAIAETAAFFDRLAEGERGAA